MEPIFKFDLGDQVKDTVTDIKGVVTARTQWMNKCVRYLVTSRKMKDDGKLTEHWLDEEQIVLQGKSLKNVAPTAKASGGPKPDPMSPVG